MISRGERVEQLSIAERKLNGTLNLSHELANISYSHGDNARKQDIWRNNHTMGR